MGWNLVCLPTTHPDVGRHRQRKSYIVLFIYLCLLFITARGGVAAGVVEATRNDTGMFTDKYITSCIHLVWEE